MAVPYYNYRVTFYMEKRARMLQRRQIRDMSNPFEIPDREFQKVFRVNKPMAIYLCEELQQDLQPLRPEGLPVHYKVLVSIQLFGDGGYQRPTGQGECVSIGQTTVSKYVDQFTKAMNQRLMPQWIQFPATPQARTEVTSGFQRKYGLPDILGAIDCTHVEIFPPRRPEGIQYINRRGRHTINVQVICDADAKIININSRYPGRCHDQFIFENSNVKTEMKRLHDNRIGEYYLLGDSGYSLQPWMMTPILNTERDTPEDRYTKWHCQSRNVIERTHGYLKGTFRILGIDRVLHYTPTKAAQIIYACATLYNLMKHFNVPIEMDDIVNEGPIQDEVEDIPRAELYRLALQKRAQLVNRYFN